MSGHLNDLQHSGQLSDFTVARIDRYITSTVNKRDKTRLVIIILDMTVLQSGKDVGKLIGTPLPEPLHSINGENKLAAPLLAKPSMKRTNSNSGQTNINYSQPLGKMSEVQ